MGGRGRQEHPPLSIRPVPRRGNAARALQAPVQDELGGGARLFSRLRLPAGASIGFHRHEGEAEVFYILSGRGLVDDDGTKREVTAGDAILTGGGAGHTIEALGDEPLEMIAVILKQA